MSLQYDGGKWQCRNGAIQIYRSLVEQRFALGLGGDHRAAGIAEDIDRRFERANEAGAPLGGLNFTLATRASSPGGWPELEAVKKAVN